jgi:perosamine synthetase
MIPLCVPQICGNEWGYVKECLDSGWISSAGPFVDRFEREIEQYTGAAHAVATSSGTAALHVALKVIGLQPGEEVLVSDFTFIASANAIHYCQANPVFMDADPETWQMDVGKLTHFLHTEMQMCGSQCLNKRTGRRIRAILPVHAFGNACEIDRIVDLAKRFGLAVVEDAAASIGVRYKGQHAGTFGDVGIISFNGNKTVTTGGGGIILTNNPQHARCARYLATTARDDAIEFFHQQVGFNYRMSNMHAALGVAQMEHIEEFLSRKRAIAQKYNETLSCLRGITTMSATPHTEATFWRYVLLLSADTPLSQRKSIVNALIEKGVASQPMWHPIHALPPYEHYQAYEIEHSIRLYARGIALPCSVGLTAGDQERVISVFRQVIAAA